jgi:hypothetical protein
MDRKGLNRHLQHLVTLYVSYPAYSVLDSLYIRMMMHHSELTSEVMSLAAYGPTDNRFSAADSNAALIEVTAD